MMTRSITGTRALALSLAATLALGAIGCATLSYQQLPHGERKRYFELAAVGTQQDLDQYLALPDTAAREQYWRTFWKDKDPTPTTDRNERYEEHLARVAYADENFGSPNYQWDDRGKVYIKYGEPDERVWYPTGDGPYPNAGEEGISANPKLVAPSRPWERWYYGRFHAEFCFVELEVGYRMVGDLNSAKSADAGATGAALQTFDVETPTLVRQLPGDAYHYDYGQPLDFPFSVSRFGGAKGAEVWVSYSVPLAKLKYDDSTHQATLDRSVVIFDDRLREVARDDRRLTPPDAGKQVPDAQAIDVCRFDLEPGSYSVAISLQDSAANKTGIYKYAFAVTNYLTRAEETSDLLLGRDIRPDSAGTKFNKAGYRIVPQPGSNYRPGRDLYLYYEIYNLRPDSARRYGAEVTYYLMAQGDKQARATAPQTLAAAGPTLCQATVLSLAGLKEGSYVVVAQVRDLAGGKMRQLANGFRIVK